MSIQSSDHLFQLVHALSKSEKRYFRVYASTHQKNTGKKFIHLFELIVKQKNYDEKKILKLARH